MKSLTNLLILKKLIKTASLPLRARSLWDALFLLVSLFLLQVYARGKWEDTIGFVRAWLNS